MAAYEEKNQVEYTQSGDSISDFAQKYIAEITRVFRFLNDLKTNTISEIEPTEPSAGQLRVNGTTLYIRNMDNTEWLTLGQVATNFGFKNIENELHPVNTVYSSVSSDNPSLICGGTWSLLDTSVVGDKTIYRWIRTE